MPISFEYDTEKNILYATIIEKLSAKEFFDALKKITDDYPPNTHLLWDASSVYMPIGNDQCKMDIIEIQKKFPPESKTKIAIITSSDFTFGTTRRYEMLSSKWPQNIMIFGNFADGEEWLKEILK
jgi:hypothetical protein